jgi:pimeloyl-ACP methyl ester carboxylesterase
MQDPFGAWGCKAVSQAGLNGITIRFADTATTAAEECLPVVLFVHGWPESWFSWRHQLQAVKRAGYRGIAPDCRGYGGTSAPADYREYSVHHIAGDMIALLKHVGAARCALVGHDHGANMGWWLALLHPDTFSCYLAMSVPYGRGRRGGALTAHRRAFGDEREPESQPKFFYQLQHSLPHAAGYFDGHSREVLMTVFGDMSGPCQPPAIISDLMFVESKAEPAWRRSPVPRTLAPFVSSAEFEYFVGEYDRAGWQGGLNWYASLDLNWELTPELAGKKLSQPIAFIAGTDDSVMSFYGGQEQVEQLMARTGERCDFVKILEGAGHWIQQEKPEAVNELLLRFVGEHRAAFAAASAKL